MAQETLCASELGDSRDPQEGFGSLDPYRDHSGWEGGAKQRLQSFNEAIDQYQK